MHTPLRAGSARSQVSKRRPGCVSERSEAPACSVRLLGWTQDGDGAAALRLTGPEVQRGGKLASKNPVSAGARWVADRGIGCKNPGSKIF
jgi:hypothetical protein